MPNSSRPEQTAREEFLTVQEIADWLKVNPQTVRNWIDRGELRAVRLGQRRVRVKQSDLERFIEASTQGRSNRGQPAGKDDGDPQPPGAA